MSDHDLPEEIIVEIMSYLPPQALIKSKTVNKQWKNLITSLMNDSAFVTKHLRNQKPSVAMTCLRAFDTPVRHCRELFSLLTLSDDDSGSKISAVTELLNLPIIPDEKNDMSCVAASHCNGLICLADYYHNVVILNPALNRFRNVARPGLVDRRFSLQGVGFGYDSEIDDYKVVRFGRDRAEVYSLRSDSWREINPGEDLDRFPSLHVELSFNGRFYWLMTWGQGRRYEIRWFDFCEEAFQSILVPEFVQVAKADWTRLGVWRGEHVVVMLHVGKRIEVWEVGSWRIVTTVEPAEAEAEIDCPLAFWNNDELLFRSSNLKDVVSYNVRTRQFRNVDVVGLDGIGCRSFTYVKTLNSV